MKEKSGTVVKAIEPIKPIATHEVANPDPGVVEKTKSEQASKNEGRYGATKVKPYKPVDPNSEEAEEKTSWVEIQLVDEEDNPIAGEQCEIKLPDGSVASGATGQDGKLKISGIDPGSCEVTFPALDKDAWEPA